MCKGPIESTCGHMWLMVWEQKSKAVVMLNRCMEGLRVSNTAWKLRECYVSSSC